MPKQRQTCTECSMRRQKCDRNTPCGRCVKRGEADKCTREWPKEGYDPKIHRTYPRHEKDEHEGRSGDHSPSSDHSSSHREHSLGYAASDGQRGSNNHSRASSLAGPTVYHAKPVEPAKEKVISFLSWGFTPVENFKIPAVSIPKDHRFEAVSDPSLEWNFSNGFGSITNAQLSFLQMLLPPQPHIDRLVEHHLTNSAWTHATLHAPTFRKELRQNSNGPNGLQLRDVDLRWAALLFSVLAGAMVSAKENVTNSWNISKDDQAKLSRQWFKAALTCLNLADYMWKHHMYSLQAICTLTLSGHLMGFSNTQTTMLSAAIKIAQSLGLQRLGPEETLPTTPDTIEKIIRIETGRRLWFQLCIQDWFSIPFSEMYCIQQHHFTTIPPLNYNDETMELLPESIPTSTTYLRYLQVLGRIMADCHDAVVTSRSEVGKYDAVLRHEAKINNWRDSLPFSLNPDAASELSMSPIGRWTRRSLLICYHHKIMMIHRNFLGRSFADPSFNSTRNSCISAAKSIIAETKKGLESDAPIFWIDHALQVAAGITLCLDTFHRKVTDPEANEHRKLVEGSINVLAKYEESMIAARGIRLLSSLLTEQARTVATESLDKYNRTKRMREYDSDGQPTPLARPFGGFESNKRPRQKFDVPRFVESLGSGDSYANLIANIAYTGNKGGNGNQFNQAPSHSNSASNTNTRTAINDHSAPIILDPVTTGPVFPSQTATAPFQPPPQESDINVPNDQFQNLELNYEIFEQFFPPQTGISNSYLFEDLLNFDF